MTELSLKDKRILFELEQDSRQSFNSIAKKVGLRKETLFHRVKNLEKLGIIKKYITEINVYKIGFQFYPILLRFRNTTPIIEQEIYKYLNNNQYVAWLTKCEGSWDINLTLIAKSGFEIQEFFVNFFKKYGQYIDEKQVFITTEVYYFKRGFWINKKTTETVVTGGDSKIAIDEDHFRLLDILSDNARKPLVEIGKELNQHPKNIANWIKKLEKENVIQGSRIFVDFSKMGYRFYKIWFSLNDPSKENVKMLISYFRNCQNIIWVTRLIGVYDLSIEMEIKTVEEFRSILDDIKYRFSPLIKKHESMIIFEENRADYIPNK